MACPDGPDRCQSGTGQAPAIDGTRAGRERRDPQPSGEHPAREESAVAGTAKLTTRLNLRSGKSRFPSPMAAAGRSGS